MNKIILVALLLISFCSCKQKKLSNIEVIKLDTTFIDSLRRASDKYYTHVIGGNEFYFEDFYHNFKDSTKTKIFKDSLNNIVWVKKYKNWVIFFSAEYYPNGQLKGKTKFPPGKVDGPATYYYPDGRVRSEGQWHNHRQVGTWMNYNDKGELEKIEYYDNYGKNIRADSIITD